MRQNTLTGKQTPSSRRNKTRVNVITPEPKKKHDLQEGHIEFRPYVFNPQFSTPTALPLSFFFGYQILHERQEIKERGHVSLVINNVIRFQDVSEWWIYLSNIAWLFDFALLFLQFYFAEDFLFIPNKLRFWGIIDF